jgi:outer membrane lipoprotein-sorting protein
MAKINLKDLSKRKIFTTRKTVLILQKLQKDTWRIHTLNKDIQKSVTDYLNRINEDSLEELINYKGSPITVFKLTPEAVKFIKESSEQFSPLKYVIYHRPKKSKGAWSVWMG